MSNYQKLDQYIKSISTDCKLDQKLSHQIKSLHQQLEIDVKDVTKIQFRINHKETWMTLRLNLD